MLGDVAYQNVAIPQDRQPEIYQGSFFYKTATRMLEALKVKVYPEDRISAFPDPALGIGSTIKLYRAQVVQVNDGGSISVYRTWTSNVGDLLRERRVELGEKDVVEPSQQEIINPSSQIFQIKITRVAESLLEISSDIVYQTINKDDPTLELGIIKVQTVGKNGILKSTFLVRRENGMEVTRTLVEKKVILSPVDKIILKGTKPKIKLLSTGVYKDYINNAAIEYNVPADKLYKLMMCESGGNIYSSGAGGSYKGLFQYSDSAWSRTAYGSSSIYDPKAQIMAAASQWSSRTGMWPTCSKGL